MANSTNEPLEIPAGALPERFSFVPGTDRISFDLLYRDIAVVDVQQVRAILKGIGYKASAAAVTRYASQTGWTGRLVLRNKMTVVGLSLIDHLAIGRYNDIRYFWVHPDYIPTKVPMHLLHLARLEMPERPTRLTFAPGDRSMHSRLTVAGWTELPDERNEPDATIADTTVPSAYFIRSIGEREYRAALDSSRPARQPSPIRVHRGRPG